MSTAAREATLQRREFPTPRGQGPLLLPRGPKGTAAPRMAQSQNSSSSLGCSAQLETRVPQGHRRGTLVATARLAFPAAPGQVQAQLRGRFHKKPKSQSCDPPCITVWQGGSPVLAPYVCLSGRRNKLLHLLPFSCISGATKEPSPKRDPYQAASAPATGHWQHQTSEAPAVKVLEARLV